MNAASLYRHRDSRVHRLPAGPKLAALPIAATLLFAFPSLAFSAAMLALVVLGFSFARLEASLLWAQLRPLLLVLALVFLGQLWFADLATALLFTVRLAALVLLAGLLTLTTRTGAIVASLERALAPLRRLGVDAARVGLAISMTIRFVPLVAAILEEVREAQAARGMDRNVLRLAVPVIVRLLKASDEIADAIDARS